jgi:hypothetical protein
MSGRLCLAISAALALAGSGLAARAADEAAPGPAARYLDAVLRLCDKAEKNLGPVTAAAETIADRHLRGGALNAWWNNQSVGPEISGRSGGFVNMGLDRVWTKDRTEAEKSNDVAFIGYDWPPFERDIALVEKVRARGGWAVGFGPKRHPELDREAAACGAFFDTGYGADDRVVELGDGELSGRINHLANVLNAWLVQAETVGALTRRGKMPAMWKSYSFPDGKAWGERYMNKVQFHDEFQVPPQPAGALAKAYLAHIRELVGRLRQEQLPGLVKAGELIAEESKAGRKTVVAWAGHMGGGYIGRKEDAVWAQPIELHLFLESQRKNFSAKTPDGALVLRLGYNGEDPEGPALFKEKKNRVIYLCGKNTDPAWQPASDNALNIPLGWEFGDAAVQLEGYPNRLFPPSGLIQAAAYGAIDVEVRARINPEEPHA